MHDLNVCVRAGVKRIIKSPTSTPNCAIYLELGLIPIEYEIKRRKLGFLHKILNSDKKGVIARIYNDQKTSFEKSGEINWYSEVDDLKKEFEINLTDTQISEFKKDGWKTIVKNCIRKKAFQNLTDEKNSKH